MESQQPGQLPKADIEQQIEVRREFKLAREEEWNGVDEATLRRLRVPARQTSVRQDGWHWSLVVVFWGCLLVGLAAVFKVFR